MAPFLLSSWSPLYLLSMSGSTFLWIKIYLQKRYYLIYLFNLLNLIQWQIERLNCSIYLLPQLKETCQLLWALAVTLFSILNMFLFIQIRGQQPIACREAWSSLPRSDPSQSIGVMELHCHSHLPTALPSHVQPAVCRVCSYPYCRGVRYLEEGESRDGAGAETRSPIRMARSQTMAHIGKRLPAPDLEYAEPFTITHNFLGFK